jgi:hypothetical protein
MGFQNDLHNEWEKKYGKLTQWISLQGDNYKLCSFKQKKSENAFFYFQYFNYHHILVSADTDLKLQTKENQESFLRS